MQEIIHILQSRESAGPVSGQISIHIRIHGPGEARIDSNIDILVEFFPDACVDTSPLPACSSPFRIFSAGGGSGDP